MLLERGYDSCPQVCDVRTEVMDMLGEEDNMKTIGGSHEDGKKISNSLMPVSFKRMVASGQASTVRLIIIFNFYRMLMKL